MMIMTISMDEVRHVARLARLELDELELVAFQGELNALLGHFQDIEGIELSGIAHKFNTSSLLNVWANDQFQSGFNHDQVFRNASVTKAGLFIVPTIIEE